MPATPATDSTGMRFKVDISMSVVDTVAEGGGGDAEADDAVAVSLAPCSYAGTVV